MSSPGPITSTPDSGPHGIVSAPAPAPAPGAQRSVAVESKDCLGLAFREPSTSSSGSESGLASPDAGLPNAALLPLKTEDEIPGTPQSALGRQPGTPSTSSAFQHVPETPDIDVDASQGPRDDRPDDFWEDACFACGGAGELLLCEECPCAAHVPCAGLSEVPAGPWICPRVSRSAWICPR